MGERISNDVTYCSRRKTTRYHNSSGSISDHAGGQLLSFGDNPSHRDLPAPKKGAKERQRSVLEALVASVEPLSAASISKALINEFSTVGRVLSENRESLERVIGCNQSVVDLLHATNRAIIEGLRAEVPLQIINSTDQRLIDYLIATMGSKTQEFFRVMFLSNTNHLICDEIMCTGSINFVNVSPRCIFKRAFELASTSLILIHNHPGGNIEPSPNDINLTRKLASLGRSLEIDIGDHIIIAGPKWFSFLRQGLL